MFIHNRYLHELCLILVALGLAAGCKEEDVSHIRVIKEPSAAPSPPVVAAPMNRAPTTPPATGAPMNPDPAPPSGMMGDVPLPPKPTGSDGLVWTLPDGWTQTLAQGVRYATLNPPGATGIEASVVVLPGPAGGELANVNRWRGTLGLAPLDLPGLGPLRKTLTTKVGPVGLYDFSSEGTKKTRLVAGLASVNGSSWFFKMTGDADAVGAALPSFTQLLSSLRAASNAN
jgi:hypothetical protein